MIVPDKNAVAPPPEYRYPVGSLIEAQAVVLVRQPDGTGKTELRLVSGRVTRIYGLDPTTCRMMVHDYAQEHEQIVAVDMVTSAHLPTQENDHGFAG